jgi:hypothetical protein
MINEKNESVNKDVADSEEKFSNGMRKRTKSPILQIAEKIAVGVFGGILGGVIGAFGIYQTQQIAQDAENVNVIQARISTCLSLAEHHRSMDSFDRAEMESGQQVKRIELYVNGGKAWQSTNFERFAASTYMARDLELCLVWHQNMTDRLECVNEATYGNRKNQVMDHVGEGKGYPLGKWSPAC